MAIQMAIPDHSVKGIPNSLGSITPTGIKTGENESAINKTARVQQIRQMSLSFFMILL
jgi:hypothetical protein